jgi:hypothetical protein
VASGEHRAAKQRQIYFQGSDPLTTLYNPFLRSRGALLVGDDIRYHSPGGAGIRGIDPRLSAGAIAGLNLEIERSLITRAEARLFSRITVALFGDVGHTLSSSLQSPTGDRVRFLGDAGVGVRAEHQIGDTHFITRFDVPLFVSRPELAQDREPGDDEFAFRWTFSFEPAF